MRNFKRRHVIKNCLHALAFAGLTGGSGWLIFRRNDKNGPCPFEGLCSGCRYLTGCERQKAARFREREFLDTQSERAKNG